MPDTTVDHHLLPYRIAVLCYLYDHAGNVLLLHRRKMPNRDMYSPVGGKLEVRTGEGPHACARREVMEETGIDLAPEHLRLAGIVSETAYQQEMHWLIFLFEVTRSIDHAEIEHMDFDEGALEWVPPDMVPALDIPETDRRIMWPMVNTHRGGGFFMVHVDCCKPEMTWTTHESRLPPSPAPRSA